MGKVVINLNILFVTLNPVETNSSAMLRNYALIKGLLLNDCEIEILTIPALETMPSYDTSLKWDDKVQITKLSNDKVYVNLVNNQESYLGKWKKKLLPYLRFFYHKISLFDYTINIAHNASPDKLKKNYYDVIISSSDPKSSHYAVEELITKGIKYGKWIQYWGDPMANDITNNTLLPKKYIEYKEKRILKLADSIIYVSKFTLIEQRKLFPELKDKMDVIPIPYIKKKVYPIRKNVIDFKLSYLGDYNSTIRNLKPLYDTIEGLGDEKIELTIAGNSDLKLQNKNNIEILPRVNQANLENIEEKSDVLVCLLNTKGSQIPGKVYHYAATNKPILVILDGEEPRKGEIRKYLESFDRYILCDNDTENLKKTIKKIKTNNIPLKNMPSRFFEPSFIAKNFLNKI